MRRTLRWSIIPLDCIPRIFYQIPLQEMYHRAGISIGEGSRTWLINGVFTPFAATLVDTKGWVLAPVAVQVPHHLFSAGAWLLLNRIPGPNSRHLLWHRELKLIKRNKRGQAIFKGELAAICHLFWLGGALDCLRKSNKLTESSWRSGLRSPAWH